MGRLSCQLPCHAPSPHPACTSLPLCTACRYIPQRWLLYLFTAPHLLYMLSQMSACSNRTRTMLLLENAITCTAGGLGTVPWFSKQLKGACVWGGSTCGMALVGQQAAPMWARCCLCRLRRQLAFAVGVILPFPY